MEAMNKKPTKCLVILSGGQDSTTCLFWAKQKFDEVHAITFEYGQRHAIEVDASRKVATMADVKSHEIVYVPQCLESTSPLTSNSELEKYESFDHMDSVIGDRVELTFVPMRNPFFFIIAANRAVRLGATALVTGICQEDNANYPDCREQFRIVFEDMMNAALGYNPYQKEKGWIDLLAPLMNLSKAESVALAYNIAGAWAAIGFTHTSYDGKYPPTDNNHSNLLRAKGFEVANLPDPLVVRAFMEQKMDLPNTENYQDSISLSETWAMLANAGVQVGA